ncbi:energy transducer TonB [Paracoccus shandongensis]|uniref:energy transducer TonB n=1 Tax=Paracoccus shandongensis TaxID=2816048 RepID=UPI001A8F88F9|nr:energy transducer TonB [Paracoccus shandongensis]
MTGRASLIREGALWGGASALVLALHLGGALWLMERAEAAAPPGLPEPVFIDLAPAEETAEETVAPAEEPVEEVAEEPVAPEPQPEPEPEKIVEPLDLPPLPQLEPLDDMAELFPPAPPELETPPAVVLNTSARPQRRPEREPEPQRQAEPRREPEPQRQAEPRRQEQPARQKQARRVEQGQQGATGKTGVSAQQLARDEASWKQQVGVCLLRSASRVSGASGARSTVALVIARNGRVQSASLTASTGNPRVDREISRAMGRARCPAAPSSLTKTAYQFVQPFAIQ